MNVYDFTVKARDGSEVALEEYRGKVILIVNTATGCGFTPQYTDLQKLYEEHREDGLEILDFPCNQFANQAPGTDEEIHTFCTGRFGITFPQLAKRDVFGENQAPLYTWLEENSRFEGFKGFMGKIVSMAAKHNDKDYKNNSKVKGTFTKFLIDREGNLVARFEPTANMKEVKKKVEEIL